MAFNSLKSTNTADYAAAGKNAAASAAELYRIQRTSGTDYGDLAIAIGEITADRKISAIKASEKVATAGINAYADLTKKGQEVAEVNNAIDRSKKKRKAGGLAAIGQLAAAGYFVATDNTKGRERPKADYSAINDAYRNKRDSLISEYESYTDGLKPPSSSGSKSGKVTTAESTGSPSSGTSSNLSSSLTGNQKIVADAIAKYESGDWGYEAFNQGGAAGGTKVLGKSGSHKQTFGRSLTDMTLGEIFHKQNTKSRGLSMDEHIKSGGLHAVGRYQFIGSTLQDEVARMGLSTDTKFTPQVQDQIWLNHIKRVGNISPWVGPSNNYSSSQKNEFNAMIQSF